MHLYHLNDQLISYLQSLLGAGDDGADDGVMPVPDLNIQTPAIGPGGYYTDSVPWTGISFVRFMRVLMTQDTECTITFYHKNTFADEDREFRAYRCANKFMWEGTWAHFDEDETKRVHFKIENTGNQSSSFQLTLKSGTMAANAYARFVEALNVNGTELTGTISLRGGNGVTLTTGIDNDVTINAVAPQTINITRWALTPKKPVSFSGSSTVTNAANITDGSSSTYGDFGVGTQWIRADMGSVVNFGGIRVQFYWLDSRTYNDVRIELSADGSTWFTVKATGPVWATENGIMINIPGGYLARYIRIWSNGSSANTGNHLTYLEPLVISDKG